MSMHITLSPELESFIRSKVESGSYGNATEVIGDAIRRMQAEETRIAAWHAAIRKGDDELERSEGVLYTSDTLKAITGDAIAAANSGKPMDPDVLP